MRYIMEDKKYSFKTAFDTVTGMYVRTGVLDADGNDTGVDPFMASYFRPKGNHNGAIGTRKPGPRCVFDY